MFQTPYHESQLVYLRSKFIHKLRNTVRGGGGVSEIIMNYTIIYFYRKILEFYSTEYYYCKLIVCLKSLGMFTKCS